MSHSPRLSIVVQEQELSLEDEIDAAAMELDGCDVERPTLGLGARSRK